MREPAQVGEAFAERCLSDLIVVDTGKSLLIAPKSRAQDIKLVVEQIKRSHPELA